MPTDTGSTTGQDIDDGVARDTAEAAQAAEMSAAAAEQGRMDQLGTRAARGAAVTFAGTAARILIQVASVVVLARLLSPADYGLMAMGLVMVGIGEIFRDLGLSTAAIQAAHFSREQRDNLFWLNAVVGLGLAVLAVFAAPLIAMFFSTPALTPLARALAVTFLLNGIAAQYRAGLNRAMKFGALAGADLIGAAVGLAVGIGFALIDAGAWSLVAQQLAQAFVVLVMLVVWGRWIPRRPRRGVDLTPFLRFGWHLMGSQIVGYLGNNLDSITIGLRLGPVPLGIYNRAFQLLMTPLDQLRTPTTTVALPVLSGLQRDTARANGFIARGQIALGYTIVPGLALGVGAALPMVHLFLGDKWLQVAPIFALLAIAGIAQTLAYVGYWVYLSRGLTRDLFRYTLVTVAIKAICIGVGSSWGVIGVAAGYTAGPCLAWPLSLWWLSRRTPLPTRELSIGALRILAVAGSAAAVTYVASLLTASWSSVVQLIVAAVCVLSVYALAAVLVPRIRADVAVVIGMSKALAHR